MIRTRNQNKIAQQNQIKPKPFKKPHKTKKQNASTDTEDQNQCINVKKNYNNIAINKPKKSAPKFSFQFNPKDQVEQYEDDIIVYLKSQQAKYKINQNYLKFHHVLNVKVRTFLLKYIFKMIWKYRCKRSTLYLAVFCMDFYFSKEANFQNHMEAIAVAQASLHMAMKFQEIYPPPLKQWTPDNEQIKKILDLQAEILRTLDFKLNFPSIHYFEQYFQKKFCETERYKENKENLYLQEMKINLIADLCLFEVSLYQYTPLEVAKNIRMLVYNIQPPFNEQRLVLNIKWTLERNKVHLDWLKEMKYKELKEDS